MQKINDVKLLKKIIVWVSSLAIIIQLFLLIFFNQTSFFSSYDTAYWKDRFEHSQWQLPMSKRILGDDGLFSYVGYKLIRGEDPTKVNAETLPIGKYLIGLSILLFHNPAWYAVIFGVGSLCLFFLIAKRLLQEVYLAVYATALLFFDRLFFSQFWKAWIDIVQLFFLLASFYCLLVLPKIGIKKQLFFVMLSGILLGLFTETKFPLLLPIIIILYVVYFYKRRILWQSPFFFVGLVISIILSYSQFFRQGHSFFNFLQVQKYIINFYLDSKLDVHRGAIFQTLLTGKFPDITSGKLLAVEEWTFLWIILFFFSLVGIFQSFKKDSLLLWKGISFFVFLSTAIFVIIPFYPRYFLLLLPFFYLLALSTVKKYMLTSFTAYVFLLVLFFQGFLGIVYLIPNPQSTLKTFYYSYQNQYFQDIFQENIVLPPRPEFTRETFRAVAQKTLQDAQIKDIRITEKQRSINNFSKKETVTITINYITQNLGSFSETKKLVLVKERQAWKIIWDWNLLLDDYKPEYNVVSDIKNGKRGTIFDATNKILVEDNLGYLVSVDPEKIDTSQEQQLLLLLGQVSGVVPVHLQNAYLENSLPDTSVALFTTFTSLEEKLKQKLLSYKGVSLTSYPSRIYSIQLPTALKNTQFYECCTRIYTSTTYHGIEGVEKEFDALLSGYNGGSIQIKEKNGRVVKTVLERESKDGKSIVLH